MKRIFALLLVFTVLLPLIGCSTQPQSISTDWVFAHPDRRTMCALSAQGCYYTAPNTLHYADIAAEQNVVLCSAPGCSHSSEACDAYLYVYQYNAMFFTNEHLYYIHYKDGGLYRRSPIGTEEAAVGTFAKEYVDAGKSVEINTIKCVGDTLYYTADVVFSEEGKTLQSTLVGFMDLNSGQDTVLLEQKIPEGYTANRLQLYAVRNGELLLLQCDGFEGNHTDADYQEKYRNTPVKLQKLDIATGAVTTLLEKPRMDMTQISLVWKNKVYYYDSRTVGAVESYVYDLETGTDEKLDIAAISGWLGGPYVTLLGGKLYNLETGEFLPRETSTRPILYGLSDSGIVIGNNIKSEEEPNKIEGVEYCYISFADMADGIQLADLKVLWTQKMGFSD